MKKQINPTIKAHLIRSAFYLLLLIAVCAIPFALAQRNATKRGVANSASNPNVSKFAAASGATQPTNLSGLAFKAASQSNADEGFLPYDVRGFPGRHARPGEIPGVRTPTTGSKFRILPQPRSPSVVLYDQYNNAGTAATSSQDFETSFDAFDDFTADDFVVPAGQTWDVSEVDVQGSYDGFTGPAVAFHVFFYEDAGGLPGTQVYAGTNQPYTGGPTDFVINLSSPAVLSPGTYWVSVQCRMDFGVGGQWYWQDRTVTDNSPAAWENPLGGFGPACPTWGPRTTCVDDSGAPDQVYRIVGTIEGGSPTPTATPSCTPIVITGSIGTGDPTQTDKLVRSGFPQTCPATTTCAIFGDQETHRYDAYTFTNTSSSTQCVTIDTNTGCTGNRFIFVAAYLGSFDPNNICTNWIGDSGLSPNPDQAFQVDVDAGQTFVVVVSEFNHSGCPSYTVTITGLCTGGTPTPTPTSTPSCTPGWQNEPPFLAGRAFASGAVANGNFYVIAGFDGVTPYVLETDFFNGSVWAAGAPIPIGHSQSRAAAVGNNIYVPGGFNSVQFGGPLNVMQIYDTVANTWSSGLNLPQTRSGAAVVAFNGKVYIISGFTDPFPTPTNTVYEYDPVSNTYTPKAPMPGSSGNIPGAELNGEIYVAGGSPGFEAAFAYNPTTHTWRSIAPPSPPDCQAGGAFALNGELWLVGCLGQDGTVAKIYNPGSDSWSTGPSLLVSQEGGSATALYNTRGYVAGGGFGGAASTTVESVGSCPSVTPTPTATGSPSATATATATATFTPTATATATFTPTATATATATVSVTPTATATTTASPTATATETPRPTPTPRPRPTPAQRPTP